MALIECYECGRQISDKAQSCPGCGAPNERIFTPPVSKVDEPRSVIYNADSNTFHGTKFLMLKLAMRAVQDLGWKIDETNENLGLITFQTALSMGSWNGVLCCLNIEEVGEYIFKVTGTGKQNNYEGEGWALDFGEAKSKADKAINRMKELSFMKSDPPQKASKYPDSTLIKSSLEETEYKTKVIELNKMINKELNRFFSGGMTDEIFSKLIELCDTREDAIYLLNTYEKIFKSDLINSLKKLNSSFASIKRNVSMFVDHGLIQEEYPHVPFPNGEKPFKSL